ncbi:protoheme IX farnesyltransferase mitochondrial [Biomphalaria glabrata]|nr:protoheme IX farnesyltransferase; mitochondrial-like [Biomphalaria glabrata]
MPKSQCLLAILTCPKIGPALVCQWNIQPMLNCFGHITLLNKNAENMQTWSRKRHVRMHSTKPAATSSSTSVTSESISDANSKKADVGSIKNADYVLRTVDIDQEELLTLHFKQSSQLVDVKAKHVLENASIYMQKKNNVYNLDQLSCSSMSWVPAGDSSTTSLPSLHLTVREMEPDKTNPGANIESIHDVEWREQKLDFRKLIEYYKMLSKMRLTGLVVLTTMAGYWIAPGSFSASSLGLCALGTALTSSAANSINQFFEVPYDCQMNRTKNRVLVRGMISPLHGVTFAAVSSISGLATLYFCVNPIVAGLGAFNLGLYTLVYTPLKRVSMINTWVGSLVGAIPPMMGWAACTGGLEPGAWLLAGILYSWQFPHFNALSWNLRPDYSRAGYRMMSVVDPGLCKRVAFRHCVLLTAMCLAAPPLGVTSWMFAADSLPLNLYLCYLGWQFYRKGDSNSSRKLFRFSLIHIPALLLLMGISKASLGRKKEEKNVEESKQSFEEQ